MGISIELQNKLLYQRSNDERKLMKRNNNGFKELISYMNSIEECKTLKCNKKTFINNNNDIINKMNDPREKVYKEDIHYSEGF